MEPAKKTYSKQRLARAKPQSTLHEEISKDEMASPKEPIPVLIRPFTVRHHTYTL